MFKGTKMLIEKGNIWQVQLLFNKIISRANILTNLFFEKLFELEPGLEKQINYDTNNSGKYFSACYEIISNLGDKKQLTPLLNLIITNLNTLKLNGTIYMSAGKAMLWSLTKTLGTNFDYEARKAWISIYLSIIEEIKIQMEENELS